LVVTAYFAIVPKFTIFVIFLKLYFSFLHIFFGYIIYVFFFFSIFSIIYGVVICLYEVKIKRLLALSAISHMGFVIFSFSLLSNSGFFSAVIYLFSYIVISLNIFAIVIVFKEYKTSAKIRNLVEFSSMLRSSYFLFFILVFTLLSVAGIPPFLGFFGKVYIFYATITQNNFYAVGFIFLLSVLSSVYYIRLIRFGLFNKIDSSVIVHVAPPSKFHAFIITISFYLNFFFLFCQGPLLLFFYSNMHYFISS
jgi:NADH-quinone oxidoreductase subunit N